MACHEQGGRQTARQTEGEARAFAFQTHKLAFVDDAGAKDLRKQSTLDERSQQGLFAYQTRGFALVCHRLALMTLFATPRTPTRATPLGQSTRDAIEHMQCRVPRAT